MIGIGKKKPPPIRSLVGEGMTVQGTVYFTEGMRIDGRVEGDVVAAGDGHSILVISEKARVIGKVMAAHVIVNGEIEGPIVCQEMLELQPKARITGDIRYDVLEMHPGALVDGELRSLKSADKPQLKLAASNDA